VQRIVARLAPHVFSASPVRQAIQARLARRSAPAAILELARTQISMLHPLFWVLSAGIAAAGAVALSSGAPLNQGLLLQALGPLLAYLGALLAFRGMGLRVLECEMVCVPSLMQITLARLVIVLGYDLGLGIGMAGIVSAHERVSLVLVLMHWLMPLLLVMGVALALSGWLEMGVSATLAYGVWVAVVAIQMSTAHTAPEQMPGVSTTSAVEGLLGLAGVLLLLVTLGRMRTLATRWLPHV
jgi:hypothetical protein